MSDILKMKAASQSVFDDVKTQLANLVAIPSVSSTSREQVEKSARQVAELFGSLGMETQIKTAPTGSGEEGMPAVIARKIVSPEAKTVLLYAHHDVQPAGPLERWNTDPFVATEKDGRLYGRGTSDDGAGVMVHYGALAALGQDCPVNVTCFIEGEEEIGSPSFRNFIEKYREELAADVIIVCDSDNWRVGEPALTASLRGVASLDVKIKVMDSALHSGAFGGPILDAVTVASLLLAKCYNEDGSLAVPGLGGSTSADVHYPEQLFKSDAGLVASYQLAGKGDVAARLWNQPALCVIGWDQRSRAESANALMPETCLRLSLRTAPGTDSEQCAQAVASFLQENVPFGAQIETEILECGPSYQAQVSPAEKDMKWALSAAWDKEAVDIGCGGAIPMTADLAQVFPQADILITGVEDPATNAHSENESQDLGDLQNAICAEALFLSRLGGHL